MKVAVIQGGPSAEAEVSRRSAAGVCGALRKAGHDAVALELGAGLAAALSSGAFEVAFPATHGRFGEDGCLQGLLEIMGIAYVGSGVLASATGIHKVFAKLAFAAAELPLAEQVVLRAGCDPEASAREVRERLGAAVVVKPASQGSAIGVTPIHASDSHDALVAAIRGALAFDDTVLIERFVTGRELTCSVLDVAETGGLRALPVTEIFADKADWYDFASKYATGGSRHRCPAELPAELFRRVQELACRAHRALGCRDLSRVDFILSEESTGPAVTLLEVNTIPGMTATSLYPEAATAAGIPFDRLCDILVRNALERARAAGAVAAVPIPT